MPSSPSTSRIFRGGHASSIHYGARSRASLTRKFYRNISLIFFNQRNFICCQCLELLIPGSLGEVSVVLPEEPDQVFLDFVRHVEMIRNKLSHLGMQFQIAHFFRQCVAHRLSTDKISKTLTNYPF